MYPRTVRSLVAVVVAVAFTAPARAHVDYVTDGDPGGSVWRLLAAVLSDPTSVALLLGGAVAGTGLLAAYLVLAAEVPDVAVAWRTLASYRPYLPWMLRLSVGLPLVGAGFAGYYFTPSVAADARLLQVGLGFLLLFGLASRAAAVVGLGAYLWGLAVHGEALLLASEYVAGFLGIVVLGSGQPSADGLLRRLAVTDGTLVSRVRPYHDLPGRVVARLGLTREVAPVVLRVALGLNFAYLGVTQKWLQPDAALAVVEKYDLTAVLPVIPELWVFGAGLVEALVGLLLVLGLFSRGAAVAAFLLLTTTLFGLPDDPVLAHVTLFGLSSAVMVTGSGPYSLDGRVVPGLRRRLRRWVGVESGTEAVGEESTTEP